MNADSNAGPGGASVEEAGNRPPPGERLLAAGDRLPDFVLPDPKGVLRFFYQSVTGAPAVFFMAANTAMQDQWDEVKELAGQAAAIRAAGADLFIVSNDGIESLEMVSKIVPEHAVWLADIKGVVNLGLRSAAQFPLAGTACFVLDNNQRIVAARGHTAGQATWALGALQAMSTDEPQKLGQVAPILMLPAVLEPADRVKLVEQISASGTPGGSAPIADKALSEHVTKMLIRRIGPEVEKAFSFDDFTVEDLALRWDGSASAADKGRAINDPAVEGRPFYLLVDLDAAAYSGGDISFPEFGPHRYQPGPGGAIVHAGALLRQLAAVSAGRRCLLTATLRRQASARP
jgi:peroxiredoxin